MDWLTFIAKIIEVTIWPIAAVVMLFIARNSLPSIIKQIKQLKYKDITIDFNQEIELIHKESEIIIGPKATQLQDDQRQYTLAKISPRAVLLESWINVEAATEQFIERNKDKIPVSGGYRKPGSPLRLLQGQNLIASEYYGLYERLRNVRNQAVHAPEFAIDPAE